MGHTLLTTTKKHKNHYFSNQYIKKMNNKLHIILEKNIKKHNFNYQSDILMQLKNKKTIKKTIKKKNNYLTL